MVSTNLILFEPELSFIQQARGTELPSPFCNLLLTYLFSKEFLFYTLIIHHISDLYTLIIHHISDRYTLIIHHISDLYTLIIHHISDLYTLIIHHRQAVAYYYIYRGCRVRMIVRFTTTFVISAYLPLML
jgi:hypothetical protein